MGTGQAQPPRCSSLDPRVTCRLVSTGQVGVLRPGEGGHLRLAISGVTAVALSSEQREAGAADLAVQGSHREGASCLRGRQPREDLDGARSAIDPPRRLFRGVENCMFSQ